MASESTDGRVSVTLSDDLDAWLDEHADRTGIERGELLRQLLAAYRVANESGGRDAPADEATDVRIAALAEEVDEKLDEVRRRVVQVKQQIDRKAPADHDHPAFDRVADLHRRTESTAVDVEEIRETLADLASRVEDHEERLADDEEKLTAVASAVVALRDAPEESRPSGVGDTRLRDIRRTAAREGYDAATCDACGETVRVSLLPEPNCPHCDRAFYDVRPPNGLFSDPTLVGKEEERGEEKTDG